MTHHLLSFLPFLSLPYCLSFFLSYLLKSGVNVGGVALGGIDVQYERGEVYPGVVEFVLQISLHGMNNNNNKAANDNNDVSMTSEQQAKTPPRVAILTARANEFKAALEMKDDSPLAVKFRTVGEMNGVQGWGLGPVLYGSVAEWIIQDRKGLRKFTNFERLITQDPTGQIMQYVYLGDTGELDQEAAETMLREYPEVVKAVFLHYVTDVPGPIPANEVPPSQWINGRPIVFFRTYVGAAIAAVQLGLMELDGLEFVVQASADKLKDVPRGNDKWIDLNRDIERADRLLD